MTNVFVMFDGQCQTWNIMTADHTCLYYGSADGVDNWLTANQAHYREVSELDINGVSA